MPMTALLSQPLLLAAGIISMRKMRKLPEIVCSTYSSLSLALISGLAILLTGEDLKIIFAFTYETWVLIVISSVLTVLSSTTKFAALRYSKASDVQVFAFLPNIWQFLVDFLIFNLSFTNMQMTGFALLFLFYGAQSLSSFNTRFFTKSRRITEPDDLYRKV